MLRSFERAVQVLRGGVLPLSVLLPEEWVTDACLAAGYCDGGRVYTPVVTVLSWLNQFISNRRSCQRAVQALNAHQTMHHQDVSSADTGGYCKARQRLPEAVYRDVQRRSGYEPEKQVPPEWKWLGRDVRSVDGSVLRIADTAANRAAYPLQRGLQAGLSYPVVRILVVFSWAVGTVLEGALAPYQGKGTGETGLLRALAERFKRGDVLLGDRYFSGFWDIVFWQMRGVDVVVRNSVSRRVDFRSGEWLGHDDHIIEWKRTARPDWLTVKQARAYPRTMRVREVRVRVPQRGFRTRDVIVITTLLDPVAYPKTEIAKLYRRRWDVELNLRSLKTEMEMEQLRCKTPETVRKEFAMFLTAYNAIRCQAALAARHDGLIQPWQLSFQGTRDAINEFYPRLTAVVQRQTWIKELLTNISQLKVGTRPDRIEPYVTKTRPKEFPPPRETRRSYRTRMMNR